MSEQTTKLGQLIGPDGKRDAIHVAVAPVQAARQLKAGQHVGLLPSGKADICKNPIGIVDPFLEERVDVGDWFWLVLYPNTITSLRHQWTHPSFGEELAPNNFGGSVLWLQELADEVGMSYEELLSQIASGRINTGNREMYGVRDSEDIVRHYKNVTGLTVWGGSVHFSCAC